MLLPVITWLVLWIAFMLIFITAGAVISIVAIEITPPERVSATMPRSWEHTSAPAVVTSSTYFMPAGAGPESEPKLRILGFLLR